MDTSDRKALTRRLARAFRITDGRKFRLGQIDPDDTHGIDSKQETAGLLKHGLDQLCDLQEKLYAQGTWAVLMIVQAMDAAGKDSVVTHVMSGLNPQGCQVSSFKAPSAEDLAHDFLWRTTRRLPERGHIGVFNRSYYEEVLVVRVHREILAAQGLPPEVISPHIWKERFEDINGFERHLHRSGVDRPQVLSARLEEEAAGAVPPANRAAGEELEVLRRATWKSAACWREYMAAYEDMIRHTATPDAPWYVVPADHKWFTHLVVAAALVESLKELHLAFPTLDPGKRKDLEAARKALQREKG